LIYLASTSPRRSALLTQIGVPFTVLSPDIDEAMAMEEGVLPYVRRMAREKALAGQAECRRRALPAAPLLGADTVVVADGDILRKPSDIDEARLQLKRLSGRAHLVHTALCLIGRSYREMVSTTVVTFKVLSETEIEAYCATGEPLGKAGGYAIQGQGALFISGLVGSYSGVVGLPLYECGQVLRAEGVL
jgi:septum formation protein